MASSLVVKNIGPVGCWFVSLSRLGEKKSDVPLSKALNPNWSCKLL